MHIMMIKPVPFWIHDVMFEKLFPIKNIKFFGITHKMVKTEKQIDIRILTYNFGHGRMGWSDTIKWNSKIREIRCKCMSELRRLYDYMCFVIKWYCRFTTYGYWKRSHRDEKKTVKQPGPMAMLLLRWLFEILSKAGWTWRNNDDTPAIFYGQLWLDWTRKKTLYFQGLGILSNHSPGRIGIPGLGIDTRPGTANHFWWNDI